MPREISEITKKDWESMKKKAVRKAPACASCWDKGYASVLQVQNQAADFEGEKSYRGTIQRKNWCHCKKGVRLLYEEKETKKG